MKLRSILITALLFFAIFLTGTIRTEAKTTAEKIEKTELQIQLLKKELISIMTLEETQRLTVFDNRDEKANKAWEKGLNRLIKKKEKIREKISKKEEKLARLMEEQQAD